MTTMDILQAHSQETAPSKQNKTKSQSFREAERPFFPSLPVYFQCLSYAIKLLLATSLLKYKLGMCMSNRLDFWYVSWCQKY